MVQLEKQSHPRLHGHRFSKTENGVLCDICSNLSKSSFNRLQLFADTATATLLIHKLPLLLDLPLYHIKKFHTAHYLKLNLHLSFLWLSTHFTLDLEFN
jgi:hypothetical protein